MEADREVTHRLTFNVPGRPVGKGRPRFVEGHVVTPKSTVDYEKNVRANANYAKIMWQHKNVVGWPMDGLYRLKVVAFFNSNQNRPDLTNILKAIEDGLNHVGYHDDRDVAIVWGEIHVAEGTVEHVEVELTVLDTPHFTKRRRAKAPGARAMRVKRKVIDGGF